MNRISEAIDRHRRLLVGGAAAFIAAAQLSNMRFAIAQSSDPKGARLPAVKPGTNTSFPPIKQIDAGVLNVGYVEAGPPDGGPILLLHGWPYDIHTYVDVAPLLS